MVKISFIIPCYNVGKYINKCIDSLKVQPFRDIEFIFINDGSTDETLNIIKEFQSLDDRAILIDKSNEGVSAARNDGLKVANGEYIFLLDSDDFLSDNAVDLMLKSIDETNCDILISNINFIENNNTYCRKLPFNPGVYTPAELFDSCRCFPTAPMLLYRREIISANNITFDPDIFMGEVYTFTVEVMKFARTISVIPEVTYNYVMRNGSASHHPNIKKDYSIVYAINKIYDSSAYICDKESFHLTCFKLFTSLTYNKYVKLCLSDCDTRVGIKDILKDNKIKLCLGKIAFGRRINLRDRLLALYILSTATPGFVVLTKLNKLKKALFK